MIYLVVGLFLLGAYCIVSSCIILKYLPPELPRPEKKTVGSWIASLFGGAGPFAALGHTGLVYNGIGISFLIPSILIGGTITWLVSNAYLDRKHKRNLDEWHGYMRHREQRIDVSKFSGIFGLVMLLISALIGIVTWS